MFESNTFVRNCLLLGTFPEYTRLCHYSFLIHFQEARGAEQYQCTQQRSFLRLPPVGGRSWFITYGETGKSSRGDAKGRIKRLIQSVLISLSLYIYNDRSLFSPLLTLALVFEEAGRGARLRR